MTEGRSIVLARHGRVDVSWSTRIPGRSFAGFVQRFESAGIAPDAKPLEGARRQAQEAHILAVSDTRRAAESAQILAPARPLVSDALFREAELPAHFRTRIALRAGIWAIVARFLWHLRQWPGVESVQDAKERANRAANLLERLAAEHGSVFLLGHGYFNRFIARELRRRGWRGPRFPGTRYWEASTYRRAG